MLAHICIFFWQITFSSVENTILVNSHRGKYSTLKKLKCACTEVYILQVENILSVENVIFVNSHRGVYYLDNFFFKCRKHRFSRPVQRCIFFRQKTYSSEGNTIRVNSHKGILQQKKLKNTRTEVYILQVDNVFKSCKDRYSSMKN